MPKSPEPKNFEQALSQLEGIIAKMESDELPLDDLLVRYEEGIKLIGFCTEKLQAAEKRIQIVTEKSKGKPTLEDFEPDAKATPVPAPTVEAETETDEIRLF
jgi:exodeoxyribonuclease VII small subunit